MGLSDTHIHWKACVYLMAKTAALQQMMASFFLSTGGPAILSPSIRLILICRWASNFFSYYKADINTPSILSKKMYYTESFMSTQISEKKMEWQHHWAPKCALTLLELVVKSWHFSPGEWSSQLHFPALSACTTLEAPADPEVLKKKKKKHQKSGKGCSSTLQHQVLMVQQWSHLHVCMQFLMHMVYFCYIIIEHHLLQI